jgi:hypothetical protein
MQGEGCSVQGEGCRVRGAGYRVKGREERVQSRGAVQSYLVKLLSDEVVCCVSTFRVASDSD